MHRTAWEILRAQEDRVARRETDRENSARLAHSMHNLTSVGVGVTAPEDPILFSVTFLERPHFTQGSLIKNLPTGIEEVIYPFGCATVLRWKRNVKGHYLGAWVALEVRMSFDYGSYQDLNKISMVHDLTFSGSAYKDLGDQVAMQAGSVGERTVTFGRTTNG